MKCCTLLATAVLSLIICIGLWVYDPRTPLTHEDRVVIAGLSAILVTIVRLLCRKLTTTRSIS